MGAHYPLPKLIRCFWHDILRASGDSWPSGEDEEGRLKRWYQHCIMLSSIFLSMIRDKSNASARVMCLRLVPLSGNPGQRGPARASLLRPNEVRFALATAVLEEPRPRANESGGMSCVSTLPAACPTDFPPATSAYQSDTIVHREV